MSLIKKLLSKSQKKSNYFWSYVFILPSFIIFLTFYCMPIITVILTSFTKWDGYNSPSFIGFENYIKMFDTSIFKEALINLGGWSFIAAFAHVGFGMLIAFIFREKILGWKITRVIFMIPNVISIAAWAMIYQFVFRNDIGILNSIIRIFSPGYERNWFFEEGYAFWAITFTWLFYAVVVTLMIFGDLMAIPDSLHEAARIDGATKWQQIILIDLPLCRNSIGTSVIASITARIAMYEAVKLTTNGAGKTNNLSMILVRGIQDGNYGYANVAGVVMIIIGLITLFVINKLFRMNESVY